MSAESERLIRNGFERVGDNLWRRPARIVPGYLKTNDPRDFDGRVPEWFAELTDATCPVTGERQPRMWRNE